MGSTCAEVDAWARNAERVSPSGGWKCFAKLATGALRFRGRDGDARIKVERECYFVPGRWRAAGWLIGGRYSPRTGSPPLTTKQAEAVMVLRDAWLESGGKALTRPMVVP